ncbi:hypothetical protein KKC16_02390 [Patescibacteria group bacterium]|nr:hypothetical protein [Patescibacteria group bacterium]
MKIANINGQLVFNCENRKHFRREVLEQLKDQNTRQELKEFLRGTKSKEILIKFCGSGNGNNKKKEKSKVW